MSTVETDQGCPRGERRAPLRPLPRGVRGGRVYKHWPAKTVTEADDHLFCLITMNHHPLHLNDVYAKKLAAGPQRRRRSARLLARARDERLGRERQGDRQPRHRGARAIPRRCSTGTRCSASPRCSRSRSRKSKLDRGTVKVHTRVLNQDGVLVAAVQAARARPAPGARTDTDIPSSPATSSRNPHSAYP